MKEISYGDKAKLDKKDKKIVKALYENGRYSIADISRKTGIPRDSVMYRIKKMEESKVIRSFQVVLNPSLLGYEIYSFVTLTLQNLDLENEKKLLNHLNSHPNVTYIAKTTGKWDFMLNIVAKNLKELDGILTEMRRKFSKIIKSYETSSIIQEHKYDYMVELI